MSLHPVDHALQTATPTVMVPRFGEFSPLAEVGHRFLAASDGLWLEVRRPWLYLRRRIAKQSRVAMPYGAVTETIELPCGPVPLRQIQRFSGMARAASRVETAAWLTWHEETGEWRFHRLDGHSESAGRIVIDRPRLEDGEHLVVDLHSHARGKAFFSGLDDTDDCGEVKFSMVLGHCDREKLDTKIRLCCLGLFIPMASSVEDRRVTFAKELPQGEMEWSSLEDIWDSIEQ